MPVNTAALKTFAPAMRRQLLEAVGRKLDLLLHSQTPDTLSTYAKQIAELREQESDNRDQLLERSAYRTMEPYAFGLLISRLLQRIREESWQALIRDAAPILSSDQQETAFALACQLIHCDREVVAMEHQFLSELAAELKLSDDRAQLIQEVCELLNRDFAGEPAG